MGTELHIILNAIRTTIATPNANPQNTALLGSVALIVVAIAVLLLAIIFTPSRRKVVKIRRYRVRPDAQGAKGSGEAQAEEPTAETQARALEGEGEAPAEVVAAVAAVQAAPATKAPRGAAKKPPKKKKRNARVARFTRAASIWMVPLLIVTALVSGYYITGTETYCAKTCHVNDESVTQAAELNHASCVSCHEPYRGLATVPLNVADRVSMAVAQFKGGTPQAVLVDSDSCVRCHKSEIAAKTTSVSGIKMSHAAPYAAGVTCTSCHAKAGHSASTAQSMSNCLPCHDGKKASADCLTCHIASPLSVVAAGSTASTATLGSGKIDYPVVDLGQPNCGGCHNLVVECDKCHGLRMPHTQEFIDGGHAPIAAFDGKQVCMKCHQLTFCYSCHSPFSSHGADWQTRHQTYSWSQGTTGCACHRTAAGESTNWCYRCHSPNPPHALLR